MGTPINQLLSQATVLHSQGNLVEAETLYKQVIKDDQNNPDGYHLLGLLTGQKGDCHQGIRLIQRAISIQSEFPAYYNNLALLFSQVGSINEMLNALKKSLQIDHNQDAIWKMLFDTSKNISDENFQVDLHLKYGNHLYLTASYQEATNSFKRVLKLDDKNLEALCNLGLCYKMLSDFKNAFLYLEQVLSLKPDHNEANHALGFLNFSHENFSKAHKGMIYRWTQPAFINKQPNCALPFWKGENLHGKSIYIFHEQGVGDEIMFSSVFDEIAKESDHTIVECDKRLIPLFQRTFSNIQFIEKIDLSIPRKFENIPDFQISMGDAFYYKRTHRTAFDNHQNFKLQPDQRQSNHFKEKYKKLFPSKITVGISWHTQSIINPEQRSITLETLLPILKIPNTQFINLQYGDTQKEIFHFQQKHHIQIYHDEETNPISNIDNFISQINALDLVITIDNSTAHFAAAIKKKTWVLLSTNPDWRWLLNRCDSPIYPDIELYRQTQLGKWGQMVIQVANKLKSLS